MHCRVPTYHNCRPMLRNTTLKYEKHVRKYTYNSKGWTTGENIHIPPRFKDFALLHYLYDPPSLLFKVHRRIFPREISGRNVTLITHLHIVTWFKMREVILPHPNRLQGMVGWLLTAAQGHQVWPYSDGKLNPYPISSIYCCHPLVLYDAVLRYERRYDS
jgi:hypothetical protein